MKAHWQYTEQKYYFDGRNLRDKKDILKELPEHDTAEGMFVLNHLLSEGGKIIGTHSATTGGVCTGVIALVDMR